MLPQVPGVRGLLRGSSHPTLIRKWFPHHELCFENCNIQHNVQLKLAFHTEPPSPKFLCQKVGIQLSFSLVTLVLEEASLRLEKETFKIAVGLSKGRVKIMWNSTYNNCVTRTTLTPPYSNRKTMCQSPIPDYT